MEERPINKKLVVGGIVLLAVVLVILYVVFARSGNSDDGLRGSAFFGFFGKGEQRPSEGGSSSMTGEEGPEAGEELPLLRKLSSLPAAGAVFRRGSEGEAVVRYVEKQKGNLYDIDVLGARETRITNDTVLRVHDASFESDGSSVLLRYVNPYGFIKTRLAQVRRADPASDPGYGLSEGIFLPDGVDALSVSPNGKLVFFLRDIDGAASGEIINLVTQDIRHVFDFPLSEWLPQLVDENTVFLTTKASGMSSGYSYRYSVDSRTLAKIIDAKNGLTTLYAPSGTKVLYSEALGGRPNLVGKDLTADDSEEIEHVYFYPDFFAFPEKCVWTKNELRVYCGATTSLPSGLLPDAWYQGKVFFNDAIWSYDTQTGLSELLIEPEVTVGETIDLTSPFLSDDGRLLFFVNKRDSMLWVYTLPQESAVEEMNKDLTPEELKDALGSQPQTN